MSIDQVLDWQTIPGEATLAFAGSSFETDDLDDAYHNFEAAQEAQDEEESKAGDSVLEVPALKSYLLEVAKMSLLEPAAEIELARLIKRGDAQALRQLVSANLRLVINMAKRYTRHGMELEDLIQEGNMGLIQAALKFDPTRGTRFSTYATWWIRQSIQRALSNKSRTIRIPIHITQQMYRLRKAARPFYQIYGRAPSVHELAAETGLESREIEFVFKSHRHMLSLDQTLSSESDDTLAKLIEDRFKPAAEQEAELQLLQERVESMLAQLPEDERQVLKLRYGIGQDCLPGDREIASAMQTDCRSVRRASIRAMRKLRKLNRRKTFEE